MLQVPCSTYVMHSNREQVAQAHFEIWTIDVAIGEMKNNSSGDFEIIFVYLPQYVLYHLHIISDWLSNIFPQNIVFSAESKSVGMGNF